MKNNKINSGSIIYISSAIALATLFLVVVLEKSQVINLYSKPVSQNNDGIRPINEVDYTPADPSENNVINDKKESGALGADEQTQPQPGAPINVVLTAATQDNPGGPVVVRVLLADVSSGTCNITMSKDSVTNNYTRNVVNAGTYFNCKALDIPVSDLSQGLWEIKVDVTSGDRFGTAKQLVEVVI